MDINENIDTVSGSSQTINNTVTLDISALEEELKGIHGELELLTTNLGVSNTPLPNIHLDDSNSFDAYYVTTSRGTIYPAVDKIQYFTKNNNGDLINVSSNTIYAYDSNGNYYRWRPLGSCEYQYTSGYNTYWDYVSAKAENSNIVIGQAGLKSFTEVILAIILFVLLLILFFKRK